MAHSQELRDRVLGAFDRGMQTKQIADTLGVCRAWVRRVKQRRRETGETTARPMGGARVIKIDVVRLAELVAEQADATIPELRDRLGVECSESGVGKALRRLGLSVKKNSPRVGAGPPRCCREAGAVEVRSRRHRRRPVDLHRRDVGENEHDASTRSGTSWRASDRQDPARTLEDNNSHRGAGHRWHPMLNGRRWRHQRRCLRSVRTARPAS